MKMDKKEAVDIITRAALNYKAYLQGKQFLIVYQEKSEIKTVQIEFYDIHFKHLTGVDTKLSAKSFYERCISHRLSVKDFNIDKSGKTQQKLEVLPYLHELLYNNCMIGSFINSGICIRADYFVGNTKAVLSVGFRAGKRIDFPVTLYKEDVRKLSQPTNRVLAIFAKRNQEHDYTKCTYLLKGQQVNKLPLPDEIRNLIQAGKC